MLNSVERDTNELQKKEEKYHLIMENSNDLISLLNGRLEFEFINNKTYFRMLGYTRDELIGKCVLNFIHPDDSVHTINNFIKGFETGQGYIEHRIRHKKGDYIWIETRGRKLIDTDGKNKLLFIGKNINKYKLIELKLIKNQKELLERRKLVSIGQLVADIAHSLKTPLSNINLTVDYLLNLINFQKIFPDPKTIHDEIIDLKNEVDFCTQIVKNLLQFSRKVDLNLKKFELNNLLTGLISSPAIISRLREKNIEIFFQNEENIMLFGDKTLLFQVFQNIINNSIDALEEVQYRPNIRITISKLESQYEIKFIDNGRGIKKSDLPRIFEPFFSTKQVGKGTGLGLPISRGIIRKHGGDITINSVYGKGTEVIINIPLIGNENA